MGYNWVMDEPDKAKIKAEVGDTVKEWFALHQFKTYADAVKWWHDAEYDTIMEVVGDEEGRSKFGTELMWLTGIFGPLEKVDHDMLKPKKKRKK